MDQELLNELSSLLNEKLKPINMKLDKLEDGLNKNTETLKLIKILADESELYNKKIIADLENIKNNMKNVEKTSDVQDMYIEFDKINSKKKYCQNENKDVLEIVEYFRESLENAKFNTWIAPSIGRAYLKDDVMIVPCENAFMQMIIEDRFLEKIREISKYNVELVIK